eukprot:Blabericola_migrator_1__1829@NODE_1499_length_4405_cov_78_417012_g480_i1_p2_GENE_NODE_1499_length_4405_cov_78_417012_g480_i1NODE_1499_length_4405_cov_78_417012_g480_i1_p2_ORF_typecomplete_len371_score75_62GFO_IDH_MocA/PF01408_22/3_4e21GFO_IDH_MocA_C/PF02894_17/1_2e10NAD_binding_3/PF03447_16/0_075_NODE_1499_length_4405_cov_78_417012_g480_i131324244
MSAPESPLRVGLIGYGFVGKTFHVPYLQALPSSYKLTVVGTSKSIEDIGDVQLEPDYEKVCLHPDVDLVVIGSPNSTHFTLTQKALKAQKHVLCDKPFVVEMDEARILINLAKAESRLLCIFQNRRWDSCFLALYDTVRSGVLGEPLVFFYNWDRLRLEPRDRWREHALPGSGIWYDLGPHMLDHVMCLFGLPHAIYADLAIQREGACIDDFCHAILEYEGKSLRVILNMSMTVSGSTRYTLHGTKGVFVKRQLDVQEDQLKEGLDPTDESFGVDPDPMEIRLHEGERKSTNVPKGQQTKIYEEVADAIKGGGTNEPVAHSFILAQTALLKAGYLSSKDRRRYLISELLTGDEIAAFNKDFASLRIEHKG